MNYVDEINFLKECYSDGIEKINQQNRTSRKNLLEAAMQIRFALDRLLAMYFKEYGWSEKKQDGTRWTEEEKINILYEKKAISKEIMFAFHKFRMIGNKGAHADVSITYFETEEALNMLYKEIKRIEKKGIKQKGEFIENKANKKYAISLEFILVYILFAFVSGIIYMISTYSSLGAISQEYIYKGISISNWNIYSSEIAYDKIVIEKGICIVGLVAAIIYSIIAIKGRFEIIIFNIINIIVYWNNESISKFVWKFAEKFMVTMDSLIISGNAGEVFTAVFIMVPLYGIIFATIPIIETVICRKVATMLKNAYEK